MLPWSSLTSEQKAERGAVVMAQVEQLREQHIGAVIVQGDFFHRSPPIPAARNTVTVEWNTDNPDVVLRK